MAVWVTGEEKKYKAPGRILEIKDNKNHLVLVCERGLLKVSFLKGCGVRITYNAKKDFLNVPSFSVSGYHVSESYALDEREDAAEVQCEMYKVCFDKRDASISIRDIYGCDICRDAGSGFLFSRDTIKCKKAMSDVEHFYGLGEKTGFLDKRGRKYLMWNTDDPVHTPTKDPLYISVPFLITLKGKSAYGIFVDKACRVWFDLGEESTEYYSFEAHDHEMDYYFIYGPDVKGVVSKYALLTGKMELPPMWSLGYQQCRWSYYPEEAVLDIARTFREKEIPCDVLYLDIDYMDGYRVFTWNEDRFPDPEAMLDKLKEWGFRVVAIVDPGVKKDAEYRVYREGLQKKLFCMQADGEVYVGNVWPGNAVYPDFSKEETRQWWGEQHKELLGRGVSGIWNDMNEPSNFVSEAQKRSEWTVPDEVIMENDGYPGTFAKYHNSYGLNMCRSAYEGFRMLKPDERPFILTRSGFAGIQKYAAVWTGDNHSWWEHLAASIPMHLNIGLSGISFVGGDVGGFQENASPELFARWIQLGCFTPLFRGHSDMWSKPHEPWAFGKEVEEICRKYIRLRYSLLPYVYQAFYSACMTGLPVMRPLVMEFQDDECVHNLCDQFLFGEGIMVAPICRPSQDKRVVYFPQGKWFDFWSDEVYFGNGSTLVDAPIDVLPLFVRDGSIIPSVEPKNYSGERMSEALHLDIYASEHADYSLYEDDGISYAYKRDCYNMTFFEYNSEDGIYTFEIVPSKEAEILKYESYVIRFHNFGTAPQRIECESQYTSFYESLKKVLTIHTGGNLPRKGFYIRIICQ